ncbi:hypothetical protein NQ314_018386 [Rhamnusium bicolor]|uniref:PiggyBac transposable element-derived protein domain-containing protein n=1 Tax=Rhamnusium bicolor TaxID=1586634 RepID=A0AAV8WT87_9CUCU|nr:hypothetical protein NQ314_018386 [Rhamnusium bicolor]
MDNYAREVERLTQMYEEVGTDEEHFSDSDDSVADPQYEEVSDHQSESGQELKEDELYEELLVESSASERDHLQFEAKDGTKWRKMCFPKNVRTRQDNIIVRLPGVTCPAKNAASPRECCHLFFDEDIMKELVQCTNVYIESISHKYTHKSDARSTNIPELRAFLAYST